MPCTVMCCSLPDQKSILRPAVATAADTLLVEGGVVAACGSKVQKQEKGL